MKAKQCVLFLVTIVLLLPMLLVPVSAQEEPAFDYELSVNGQDTVEVNTGDIITVTLYLYRTDADTPYTMYAMQDEIRYDSEFFELVEDSEVLSCGIASTDIDVGGGLREFYMNFLSFSGGAQWQPRTCIGSFQLRVIGTTGVSIITNEDYLVSNSDGMSRYDCEANELTVILSSDCEVKFESNGGTKIDPAIAIYGEKLIRPEDPVREGMYFEGWYKDIHLTEKWDFDTDTVRSNMKLYAKWTTEEPGPDFEPDPPQTPDESNPCCIFLLIAILVILALAVLLCCLLIKRKKSADEVQDDTDEAQDDTDEAQDGTEEVQDGAEDQGSSEDEHAE